jgi:hypothetical protein
VKTNADLIKDPRACTLYKFYRDRHSPFQGTSRWHVFSISHPAYFYHSALSDATNFARAPPSAFFGDDSVDF